MSIVTRTNINEIWEQLEESATGNAILIRRISAETSADLYVGIRNVDRHRCLIIKVESSTNLSDLLHQDLKDLTLAAYPDSSNPAKTLVILELTNRLFQDLFTVVCEDLISNLEDLGQDELILRTLLDRLAKWEMLFDRGVKCGLTGEEQRGLFGELLFLESYLAAGRDYYTCLCNWGGPEKSIRDFQADGWGVEVKTTHGNNHQKIIINSERQLDGAKLSNLYIYHYSIEVQHGNGQTLNRLVAKIRDILKCSPASARLFDAKLAMVGYFSEHLALYDETGYQIRAEAAYQVKDDFPRIEELDLRKGVGDVKYSIILSGFEDYMVEPTALFDTIK